MVQLQAYEGPCVKCFRTAIPVSVTDLSQTAERWPRFHTALTAALTDREPYRFIHALPLRLRGGPSAPSTCSITNPSRNLPPTWPSDKHWPTWPPSASCPNAA